MYRRFVLIERQVHGRNWAGDHPRHGGSPLAGSARSGKLCREFEVIFEWLNEHLPRRPGRSSAGKASRRFKPEARACRATPRGRWLGFFGLLGKIPSGQGGRRIRAGSPIRTTHQLVAVPDTGPGPRPLLREGFEVPIHVAVDDGQGDPKGTGLRQSRSPAPSVASGACPRAGLRG